jgi:hypothetical protein
MPGTLGAGFDKNRLSILCFILLDDRLLDGMGRRDGTAFQFPQQHLFAGADPFFHSLVGSIKDVVFMVHSGNFSILIVYHYDENE